MIDQEQAWNKYVVDTNVIIYTMQGVPETEEDKKDLRRLLSIGSIIEIDSKIALKAVELRALSRKIYNRKMKLSDALIAATAFIYSGVLVSCNIDDFKHLCEHGLYLYNPFERPGKLPNDRKS